MDMLYLLLIVWFINTNLLSLSIPQIAVHMKWLKIYGKWWVQLKNIGHFNIELIVETSNQY